MEINELDEIAKEVCNFENAFAVNACRSPEEDLDEHWEGDMYGAWDADDYMANFLDDKTGKVLDLVKVRAAREE